MKVSTSSARASAAVVLFSNCLTPPWIFLKRRRLKSSSRIIAPTARAFRKPKGVRYPVLDDNAMYIRDYSKCILCWRCVQVCADDAQFTYAINFKGRGFDTATASLTSPCRKRAAYFAASAWCLPHRRASPSARRCSNRDLTLMKSRKQPRGKSAGENRHDHRRSRRPDHLPVLWRRMQSRATHQGRLPTR